MQTEQKRKAVKKLRQGFEERAKRKNRQIQELFEKHKAAVKEQQDLERKVADMIELSCAYANDDNITKNHQERIESIESQYFGDKEKQEKDENDFTEWARDTIYKELAKVDPYSTSTLWRYVLSLFKDYLDQGGTVCAGFGLRFPLPRDEKLFFAGSMQSFEELGFIVHYNQVANDKYEFFVTKY